MVLQQLFEPGDSVGERGKNIPLMDENIHGFHTHHLKCRRETRSKDHNRNLMRLRSAFMMVLKHAQMVKARSSFKISRL